MSFTTIPEKQIWKSFKKPIYSVKIIGEGEDCSTSRITIKSIRNNGQYWSQLFKVTLNLYPIPYIIRWTIAEIELEK